MSAFDTISLFFATNVREIIIICSVYLGGQIVLSLYARRLGRAASQKGDAYNRGARANTVARLVHDVLHAVLLLVVIFWTLRLVGIDPTPIIASAGVVGLAVGFGAQALVKDFISGLFIIAENQYSVGDRVKIAGFEGIVDSLSIRSTILHDDDGNKIFIPNGSVTSVVNLKQL